MDVLPQLDIEGFKYNLIVRTEPRLKELSNTVVATRQGLPRDWDTCIWLRKVAAVNGTILGCTVHANDCFDDANSDALCFWRILVPGTMEDYPEKRLPALNEFDEFCINKIWPYVMWKPHPVYGPVCESCASKLFSFDNDMADLTWGYDEPVDQYFGGYSDTKHRVILHRFIKAGVRDVPGIVQMKSSRFI